MAYKEVPGEYDFSTIFPTYIIAFCPDTDEWFVTNQRFFYYEYDKEFKNKQEAIEYFHNNENIFKELRKEMSNAIPFYNLRIDELDFV